MHNIYIVDIKLKSNNHDHDQQKCKMIKTLVLLVCQLIPTSQLHKPYLEKDIVHNIIVISRVV